MQRRLLAKGSDNDHRDCSTSFVDDFTATGGVPGATNIVDRATKATAVMHDIIAEHGFNMTFDKAVLMFFLTGRGSSAL